MKEAEVPSIVSSTDPECNFVDELELLLMEASIAGVMLLHNATLTRFEWYDESWQTVDFQ